MANNNNNKNNRPKGRANANGRRKTRGSRSTMRPKQQYVAPKRARQTRQSRFRVTGGANTLRVRGEEMAYALKSQDTTQGLASTNAVVFRPGDSTMQRLNSYGGLYELYRVYSIIIHYRTAVGTTKDGAQLTTADMDGRDLGTTLADLQAVNPKMRTPVWQSQSLTLPTSQLRRKAWYTTGNKSSTPDMAEVACVIQSAAPANTTPTVYGEVWVQYDVEFSAPARNNNQKPKCELPDGEPCPWGPGQSFSPSWNGMEQQTVSPRTSSRTPEVPGLRATGDFYEPPMLVSGVTAEKPGDTDRFLTEVMFRPMPGCLIEEDQVHGSIYCNGLGNFDEAGWMGRLKFPAGTYRITFTQHQVEDATDDGTKIIKNLGITPDAVAGTFTTWGFEPPAGAGTILDTLETTTQDQWSTLWSGTSLRALGHSIVAMTAEQTVDLTSVDTDWMNVMFTELGPEHAKPLLNSPNGWLGPSLCIQRFNTTAPQVVCPPGCVPARWMHERIPGMP